MEDKTETSIDPKSGFNRATKTFHSLKPPLHLPPPHATISAPSYILSLRRNSPWSDSITALIDSATGRHLSYAEFIHRSETLASNLTSLFALSKYDTALILSPNLIHVPILHFALLSLGVVVSPTNPLATRSDLTRIVRLSKPTIAFATSASVNKLPDEFRHGTVLIDSPEFESLMSTSRPGAKLEHVEVSQSDVAAILYSSGTTGKVKGVMLTHRNLTAMAGVYDVVRAKREKPAVFLYTMPFFHVFGFTYSLRAVVLLETVVLMERFGLRRAMEAIESFRVTHIAAVPSIMVAMMKDEVTAAHDLSSLECVACGAAPLGKDTAATFKSKFPKVLVLQARRCRTTGKLMPGVEAKIVNPHTGDPMFPDEQGELWLRGPSIMKGYVGDPEATSATLVDGWLRTGDLCYFDHEGFLYVLDRFKDLIKYKGYQVAPAELEQLLHSHLEINDAAVIPYPDEEAGQIPMAFVVRKPQSSLDEAEIIDFVAKQVAPYKKIRRVTFVDLIPKNAAGKILRKDLNKIALERSISRL
ncbi:hypothetical protein PIB30_027543 [Stylosanthes scabra]|uniref:4-coumarate--CoA ligase n=1 Tax=Stylosanthes scabra TaxID=79078 RepID=A0ABU6UDY3_9FABA|nr:hypothetical protein [Stylosanthes scabra]